MRQTCRAGRIAAGGAAGALWACGGIFLPLSFPMKAALTCGPVSLLMVFLAFRERNPVRLLKGTAALYLTAVLMAGGLELVKGLSARVSLMKSPQTPGGRNCLFVMLFFAAAVFFFITSCYKAVGRTEEKKPYGRWCATIFSGEKSSGAGISHEMQKPANRPVSGRPVSVIWAGALEDFLTERRG